MPKVRILPDRVANQIAAGEVIERPAAVVKELVENSLDAGARRIAVEFRNAGRALIVVEDNGQGMSAEDARLSIERHATSKITEAADLDRLGTFGFRGEALPSIASISRFTLGTRAVGADAGVEIVVDAGRLARVRALGLPVGTRISVEGLFEPVPARRKFLKSDRTEAAHIIHCVRLYALGSPGVAFTLFEDGDLVFRSPECPSLADRVTEIFGADTAAQLTSVDAAEGGMKLSGLVGLPGAGRPTRRDIVAFVNGRPVDSRALNQALVEGYRGSLPEGRFPAAFVFFECDPAAVDVNVHPAKREVRFRNETAVRSFVIRSVLGRLRSLAEMRAGTAGSAAVGPGPAVAGEPSAPDYFEGAASAASPTFAPSPMPAPAPPREGSAGAPSAAVSTPPSAAALTHAWRFVGTALGTYVLFEAPGGIVLLDRSAAHQRVWFERLRAEFASGSVAIQRLLLPLTLEADPITSALILDHAGFLTAHGFEIAEFGRHFFRIEAVPAWMEPAKAEPFLRDPSLESRHRAR